MSSFFQKVKERSYINFMKRSGFYDPQDTAINQRAISTITLHEDWNGNDSELFLFAAPCCRYDVPYISFVNSYVCVTNQRMFIWKLPNNRQPKDARLEAGLLPSLNQLNLSSITRFKRRQLKASFGLTLPGKFYRSVSVRAEFFDGNNPIKNELKREQWWFWSGEKIIDLFEVACLQIGIQLDDPGLNKN